MNGSERAEIITLRGSPFVFVVNCIYRVSLPVYTEEGKGYAHQGTAPHLFEDLSILPLRLQKVAAG